MTVTVGIGEVHTTADRSLVLAAYGLGSCVGVSLYDPVVKAGGLAHIMLPDSQEAKYRSTGSKFADVAVPRLIHELLKLGASQRCLICKIAGGAQMLVAPGYSNSFRIGERNIEAVRSALQGMGIVPVAMDTGGTQGRTLRLFVDTGRVLLRTAGRGEVEI